MTPRKAAHAGRTAWFLSLICVFAGLFALAVSYGLRPETQRHDAGGVTADVVRDIGILLASIGSISILYEWLIRKQLLDDFSDALRLIVDPDSRRLGFKAPYRDRAERLIRGETLDALITEARSEMFCLGIGLIQFVPERQQLLISRMREGVKFKFLIFDAACPASAVLDSSLGTGNGDLLEFIRSQTGYLRTFVATLESQRLSDKFEIRLYDLVPTFGLIQIDEASRSGRLVVELNGYQAEGATCPGFELDVHGTGWTPFFVDKARLMWKGARPLQTIGRDDS